MKYEIGRIPRRGKVSKGRFGLNSVQVSRADRRKWVGRPDRIVIVKEVG